MVSKLKLGICFSLTKAFSPANVSVMVFDNYMTGVHIASPVAEIEDLIMTY